MKEQLERLKGLRDAMEQHWRYLRDSTYHPFSDERAHWYELTDIIEKIELQVK